MQNDNPYLTAARTAYERVLRLEKQREDFLEDFAETLSIVIRLLEKGHPRTARLSALAAKGVVLDNLHSLRASRITSEAWRQMRSASE